MGAYRIEEGDWERKTHPKRRTVGKIFERDMFEGL